MISTRTGGRLLLAAAPILLAADLVRADHSQDSYAAQLADVAAARGRELASAGLFVIAGVLVLLASFGLIGLAHGRGRRAVGVGTLLLAVSSLWLVAGRGLYESVVYAASAPSLPRAAAAATLGAIGDSSAFALFLPLLAAMMLAPLVLGVGLWRAGTTAVWPAVVWVVGLVAFLAVEGNRLGELVTFGAMTGVLAWIGFVAQRGEPLARARRVTSAVEPGR